MNRDEIWARWSPEGARWSPWVKPVLFSNLGESEAEEGDPPRPSLRLEALLPPGDAGDPYRSPARSPRDLAVIVDLPGVQSVGAGLALASLGFQPVPLYTSLPWVRVFPSQRLAVETWPVVRALAVGARLLPRPDSASPPAFLLDSRRLTGGPSDLLDNRTVISWSDFPTPEQLRQSGIARVMVWGAPAWDVAMVLRQWRSAGLPLLATDGHSSWPLTISFWTRVRHWFQSQAFYGGGPSTS